MSRLVDTTGRLLIEYIRRNGLKAGDPLPAEVELSEKLGVARTVLREALSGFKRCGIIECRTKRGMRLCNPQIFGGLETAVIPELMDEDRIFDIVGMRAALESGLASLIEANAKPSDIAQLGDIAAAEERFAEGGVSLMAEYQFHTKLAEMSGNKSAAEFLRATYPVVEYAVKNYPDRALAGRRLLESRGEYPGHPELVVILRRHDAEAFQKALAAHCS